MAVIRCASHKVLSASAIALLLLSCSLFSRATPQPVEPPAAPVQPIQVEEENQPTSASQPPSLNQVQVDYVYTSNLITILYPLYGSTLDDFAIITITNTMDAPLQVLVESEVTGYTGQSIDTLWVEAGEAVEVRQNPRLVPEKIDQLNVEKPAQFHLRVAALLEGEQKLLLEETGETLVYARRDFPWAIPGFTDAEVFELVTSMVTPNDPAVEELIRAAAEYTSSGIMWSGYGDELNDESGKVWERLEALWEAETQDYDLTYVSTWVSYAPGSVQRVRLPVEVLEQHSGNCIELALLFAAAAEALDLETALVRVPGHAFMGVRIDQENADYYFIETTLIGKASFEEAVESGARTFEEALPHMDAGDNYYNWVSIWDARQKGILPLPWR